MRKNHNGFTIIEIVITVTVIAVLVGMAFFGYTQVQKDSRNSQRASKVKIIAEELEAYYAKNGEYPGCSAMTQSASQVRTNTLKGIELDVLKAPLSPSGTTNSIGCTALTAGAGTDTFAYVGDGSATCSTGTSCLQYTLQYRDEGTGAIVSKDSTHRTSVAGSGTSTITATTISNTQINLSWTAISNVASYTLQRATNAGFTTNLVSTPSIAGTTSSATSLTPGTTYYFRVAGVGTGGQTGWSNVASATTTISQPNAAPTMTATLNGTNAEGTINNSVTCSSGTVQHRINYRVTNINNTPGWSGWSAWGTATTRSIPALQGHQYGFQAESRCTGPNASSSSRQSVAIPTVVRPIATPAAPTYMSPGFFDSPNYAIVNYSGSCPSNTNTVSATFRSRDWTGGTYTNPWGFNDWWVNNSGSNKSVEYWGKYQCETYFSISPMSPESYNVITVTP